MAKVLGPTKDFSTWRSGKRTENPQGNRLLEGTSKTLCGTGSRRKEQAWVNSGLPQGWNSDCNSSGSPGMLAYVLVKEVTITSITPTIVWPQTELQPHLLAENWIKDLIRMALPIRARPSFTHRQSLPAGSFHKPLNLNNQRAERMKTTIKEN